MNKKQILESPDFVFMDYLYNEYKKHFKHYQKEVVEQLIPILRFKSVREYYMEEVEKLNEKNKKNAIKNRSTVR